MNFLPINLPSSGIEIIILAGVFIVLFALALVLGKGRMIAFILSFYPAALFYSQFPFFDKIIFFKKTDLQVFLNSLALFFVFFILTFLIINFITGRSLSYSVRGKTLKTTLLAFSAWLLVLMTINQIVVMKGIEKFFPLTHDILGNPNLFFWFLAIPLVIILIFIRR